MRRGVEETLWDWFPRGQYRSISPILGTAFTRAWQAPAVWALTAIPLLAVPPLIFLQTLRQSWRTSARLKAARTLDRRAAFSAVFLTGISTYPWPRAYR